MSSDLENLEMSGNFDASRKSQGVLKKNKKSQGKDREICCVKFIFSQPEVSNFKNFLGEYAPKFPQTVLDTHKNLIVVGKSQGISSLLETGHPVKDTCTSNVFSVIVKRKGPTEHFVCNFLLNQ